MRCIDAAGKALKPQPKKLAENCHLCPASAMILCQLCADALQVLRTASSSGGTPPDKLEAALNGNLVRLPASCILIPADACNRLRGLSSQLNGYDQRRLGMPACMLASHSGLHKQKG